MKYLRRTLILHRAWTRIFCATLCLLLLCGAGEAQRRPKQKTPRAIALVEWPAKGKPVVVPIAILVDGQWNDASIYMADPVPMALDDGNVYEVEKSGDPVGFVTLDGARNANGNWTGIAKFQTKDAVESASKGDTTPAVRPDPVEGPPRLTRGNEKPAPPAKPSTPQASTTQPASGQSDDGPPRLSKPPDETPSASIGSQPGETTTASKSTEERDPDFAGRPRLRRGKPVETVESSPAPMVARSLTTSAVAHGRQPVRGAPVRVLPAISDAGGPEPHSFVMPGSETASAPMESGMKEMARAALQKFADTHGGGKIGELQDVDVRAFDLSLSNQATVVLTASAHPAPAEPARTRRATANEPPPQPADASLTYWITVVARENFNGELRQLRAWSTDSKHLDAYPRMELIDALDADGDGRGELLFRSINDQGRSFVIARPSVDQVVALYNSGQLGQ